MDYPAKVNQIFEKASAGRTLMTASGLERAAAEVPYPAQGDQWGKWKFDAERLALVFGNGEYEVDLENMNSSAQMLDWIFQISNKSWATRKDVGDLVQALQDLLSPQGNLCSMGAEKHLDATKFLREHIRTGKAA